jgi:hypothetical protein
MASSRVENSAQVLSCEINFASKSGIMFSTSPNVGQGLKYLTGEKNLSYLARVVIG